MTGVGWWVVVAVSVGMLAACNSDNQSGFRSLSKRGEVKLDKEHAAAATR
jgi:hypothetical protein